jgi:hypothetical protein
MSFEEMMNSHKNAQTPPLNHSLSSQQMHKPAFQLQDPAQSHSHHNMVFAPHYSHFNLQYGHHYSHSPQPQPHQYPSTSPQLPYGLQLGVPKWS